MRLLEVAVVLVSVVACRESREAYSGHEEPATATHLSVPEDRGPLPPTADSLGTPEAERARASDLIVSVRDHRTGELLEGAQVIVRPAFYRRRIGFTRSLEVDNDPTESRTATTSRQGTANIEIPYGSAQHYALIVLSPTHVDSGALNAEAKVVSGLEPGERRDVVLRLVPGVRVIGRVIDDSSSTPVSGAQVVARRAPDDLKPGWSGQCWTETEPTGAFTVGALPRDARLLVSVTAPGYGTHNMTLNTGTSETQAAPVVRLRVGGAILGVVRLRNSKTTRGATVFASVATKEAVVRELERSPWPARGLGAPSTRTLADSEGLFEFVGLERGRRYTLYAIAEAPVARAVATAVAMDTTQATGATTVSRAVLELTPYAQVRVRLVDERGTPVRRVEVAWYVDDHGRYLARTDSNGWAPVAPELGGLSAKRIRFRALVEGYEPLAFVETVPESGELRLEHRITPAR